MSEDLLFAGFDSSFEKSEYVLAGVPYDGTSSFRLGCSEAPEHIRKASYCFEPYLMEYQVSLNDLLLHDLGDISFTDFDTLRESLNETVQEIIFQESFPIILGGEHSLSPIVISALKEKYEELGVVILDAHLDFRDSYEGIKHSHATASKRMSEIVGVENTTVVGVRSMAEEYTSKEIPSFFTSDEMEDIESTVDRILQNRELPTYLSIDMDVVDPSYAPGVGNPEPFGLIPTKIKNLISKLSPYFVGMDIVEVCPKYDSSEITSNLAARMVYEMLGAKEG